MRRLAEQNRGKLIDLLMERLAFERAAMGLYDVVIGRLREEEPAVRRMLPQVEVQRDQEAEHVDWLETQVRALGGNPEGMTGRSRLVARELSGVEEVVRDRGARIAELLHALLAFELSDAAGWRVLVALAERVSDEPARLAFDGRLRHEEAHCAFLQRALEALTENDVTGAPVTLPAGL
jgi:bacterioferritin (cytochrome b1)